MNHKARTPQSLSEQSTNQQLEQMTKQEVEVDCRAMSSDVASSSGELESSRKWLNSRRKRYSLAINVKKLSRDSAKCLVVQLENFKRQLMQSLNDDSQSQADAVDIRTYDQSVPRAYPDEDEVTNGYESENSYSGSADSGTVGEGISLFMHGLHELMGRSSFVRPGCISNPFKFNHVRRQFLVNDDDQQEEEEEEGYQCSNS
ncbi:hypothetical protein LINPERHAP2_LOCUS21837 [Linum perenne]